MNIRVPLHKNKPDRQAKLRAYLELFGIEHRDIADRLGCSTSMVSMILRGERATKERVEQLVALGVPRRLLPEPPEPRKQKEAA